MNSGVVGDAAKAVDAAARGPEQEAAMRNMAVAAEDYSWPPFETKRELLDEIASVSAGAPASKCLTIARRLGRSTPACWHDQDAGGGV